MCMKLEILNVDEMIEGSDLVRSKIVTDARSGRSSLFYIIKTKTPKYKNIRKNEEAVAMVIGPRSIKRKKKKKENSSFFPLNFYDSISTTFSHVFISSDPFSRSKKKSLVFFILLTESLDPSSYAIRIFGYGRLLLKSF